MLLTPQPDDWLSSARTGVGVGAGFLALYLAAGLLFARWSVAAFLAHLTVSTALWLLVAGLFVIAVFAVPVVLYQQYSLVSPLTILTIVLLGWLVSGALTGALFGLSVYLFWFAPAYLVLYAIIGVSERYLRNHRSGTASNDGGRAE